MFNSKKENSSRFYYYLFALLVSTSLRFCSFENFADLKFFGGVHLPFDLWVKAFPVPEGYQVLPCSEIEETLRVGPRVPVLFKSCIAEEHLNPTEYIYFPESKTNVFPECDASVIETAKAGTRHQSGVSVERHFEFESIDGEIEKYSEWYPCADARPVKTKVEEWLNHDLETQGPHSELNVYMLSTEEKRTVLRDWAAKNITDITPTFLDNQPLALANFFHVGRTAVDYMHAHMDHGIMLNFQATKVWTLIAPEFHDNYDYLWSGNANVLLKEHKVAPRVVIHQEKGDILYVPSWWLHKVGLLEETKTMENTIGVGKNFGLSLHMMRSDQFTGWGAHIAYEFGITNWFYRDSFDQ